MYVWCLQFASKTCTVPTGFLYISATSAKTRRAWWMEEWSKRAWAEGSVKLEACCVIIVTISTLWEACTLIQCMGPSKNLQPFRCEKTESHLSQQSQKPPLQTVFRDSWNWVQQRDWRPLSTTGTLAANACQGLNVPIVCDPLEGL